jgi:hypothetical protein
MTRWQIRLLAAGLWLGAIAFGIAFAGLYSEYTDLRDARPVDATVASVAPYSKQHVAVELRYDGTRSYKFWPKIAEAPAVGSTVPLLVSRTKVARASELASAKPSLLLVGGAIACALLGGLVWWMSGLDAKRRAARREPIDVVIDAARRTRNVRTAAAAIFVACAPLFALLPSLDTQANRGEAIAMYVLAALSAVVAVTTAAMAYRLRDPRRNFVVELIEQRPSEIAWFYLRSYRGRYGAKAQEVAICTTAGKRVQLRLVPEDVEPLLAELARRAPRARRGYDIAIERAYKKDPASVLPASSRQLDVDQPRAAGG